MLPWHARRGSPARALRKGIIPSVLMPAIFHEAGRRQAVCGIGGRSLSGFHYTALLSHTKNLKQTLQGAILPRYTAGGKGLYGSIDIEHCKAIEQGHSNATDRRYLGHTLFSCAHALQCTCALSLLPALNRRLIKRDADPRGRGQRQ